MKLKKTYLKVRLKTNESKYIFIWSDKDRSSELYDVLP